MEKLKTSNTCEAENLPKSNSWAPGLVGATGDVLVIANIACPTKVMCHPPLVIKRRV
jgi:hypothetical protein